MTAAMTPQRATDPYDWPALLALLRRAFAHMDGIIDPPSSLHILTAQGIAEQARRGEVWVIGQPALACVFLTPKPDALYLGKLAVDPAHQGSGLGRRLVENAAQRARALGLPTLELQTRIELTTNHAAFRRMGFVQTAATAHPGYSRPTTLTFRRMV